MNKKKVRVSEEKKFSEADRERNMDLGIREGSAMTVTSIITDTYMTPFTLALGGNSLHVGFLSSFSGLLSPLSQLYGCKAMDKWNRRKLMVASASWQTLMLLPIILLAVISTMNFREWLPNFLIIFYSLYIIFGAIAGLVWFSLMGDIVPAEKRGRYFGKRNSILGGVGIFVSLVGSFLLDFFKTEGNVLIGFSILFLAAIIGRIISLKLLAKYDDPDGNSKMIHEGFVKFSKTIWKTNYGKFVIYVGLLNFAAMVASPFFNVYMLQELHLSYMWFTIINLLQAISMAIFMLVWGKFADKYGNKIVLIIGNCLIPLLPLLWLFSQNVYWLFVPMFLGGIGWAAFNLASNNFIYDSVEKEKRAAYLAYVNVYVGVGIFLGAIAGGLIVEYAPVNFMNIFLFVFLVSAILRMIAGLVMLPLVKEVRPVEKFSLSRVTPLMLLKMLGHNTSFIHHFIIHHHEHPHDKKNKKRKLLKLFNL